MTPAEVAALLTAAKALDDRVTPDPARVSAWHAVLAPDMDPQVARDALVTHYATELRPIMPADVNARWKAELRRRAEERSVRDVLDAPPGVPCPPELARQMRELIAKAALK